jgi:hypothetical protein
MNDNDENNGNNAVVDACVEQTQTLAEKGRFDPVISKISKPLKPQGVHAGLIKAVVKGSF